VIATSVVVFTVSEPIFVAQSRDLTIPGEHGLPKTAEGFPPSCTRTIAPAQQIAVWRDLKGLIVTQF